MLCSRHTRTVGATVTDCSRVVLSSSILYRRFLESPLRFGAFCLASLGVTRHDSLCPSSSFVLDNTNGQLLYRLLAFVRRSSIDPSVKVLDSTLHSFKLAVAVDNSPKPPAERVSISVDRLANASAIYIFALGEGKREALVNLLEHHDGPVALLQEVGRFAQMVIATDLQI